MSTEVIALLVAVVGVAGTLLAPITTAWVSSHQRRQEFELQQHSEQTKRHIDDTQADLERRRDIYVALNSGARRYRFHMMEDLYAIRSGVDPASETEVVRVEFQDTYAQAQMLVPDNVLQPCQAVRVALAEARKLLGSLTEGGAHDQQMWQETHAFLLQMWDAITAMQLAMRQDLGISTPPPPVNRARSLMPDDARLPSDDTPAAFLSSAPPEGAGSLRCGSRSDHLITEIRY